MQRLLPHGFLVPATLLAAFLPAEEGALRAPAPGAQLEIVQTIPARRSQGRGASLSELLCVQTSFLDSTCSVPFGCGEPCTAVLLSWAEESSNPGGVEVFVDGELAATVPGLPPEDLPGRNSLEIVDISEGLHSFEVQDVGGGTGDTCEMAVLAAAPLADPTDVSFVAVGPDADGTCVSVATWETARLDPAVTWTVLLDGELAAANVPGTEEGIVIRNVPQGAEHCVDVVGNLSDPSDPRVLYRSCRASACATVACEPSVCPPPLFLRLAQSGYGPQGEIRTSWVLPFAPTSGGYAGGIRGYLDGASVGELDGAATLAFLSGVPPGDRTFGVEGDCGAPRGPSEVQSRGIRILGETPVLDPVEAEVVSLFDAKEEELTVVWAASRTFAFVDVYSVEPQSVPGELERRSFLDSVGGDVAGVIVRGVADEETSVELQFFEREEDVFYGSETIGSVPFDPCRHCPAGEIACGTAIADTFPRSNCPLGGQVGPATDVFEYSHPGGAVTLRVETAAFSARLEVYGADCALLVAGGSSLALRLEPGTYGVAVVGVEGSGGGPYELSVDCAGAAFLRGACGDPDQAEPSVTEAIFLLSFLYQSGSAPPCFEACDVDGNGSVEITDAVYLLLFLYQGGPPPPGWNGTEPSCEPIGPGTNCAVPSTACPL